MIMKIETLSWSSLFESNLVRAGACIISYTWQQAFILLLTVIGLFSAYEMDVYVSNLALVYIQI